MINEKQLEGKICLITGATSGIGWETAIAMARAGARLVLPVRSMEKGEALRNEIHHLTGNGHADLMDCDLASLESVRAFADSFREKYDRLDILINNAGVWEMKRKESADGIELTFAVNHLAPFLLTYQLTDLLIASAPSRVINVSSMAHRFGKIRFHDLEGKKRWSSFGSYAQSKLANILFSKELSRKMNGAGVTVNSLHPGMVNTRLFRRMPEFMTGLFRFFMINPEKGAQTSVYLATSPDVQNVTASYFRNSKLTNPAPHALNDADAKKLWEISMGYVNGAVSLAPQSLQSSPALSTAAIR